MALDYNDGSQEYSSNRFNELDWSNFSDRIGYGEGQWAPGKYAGGLIGGAWDKLKAFQDDEEEIEIDNPEEDRTSIAQDLLGMVGGAWDKLTDRGATVQDYFADYKKAKPDPARFGRWRTNRQSTTEIPDYLKRRDTTNLVLKAWNNPDRPAGVLTSPFITNMGTN